MATSPEFMQFVYDQVKSDDHDITYKKMFGEYMLYCDGRAVLLICDDTVFVKQIPASLTVFEKYGICPETGTPYNGAKPHYILDIDNTDLARDMVRELARVLPVPTRKKRTKNDAKN